MKFYSTVEYVEVETNISIEEIYNEMNNDDKQLLFKKLNQDGDILSSFDYTLTENFIKDLAYKIKYHDNTHFKLLLTELKYKLSDSLDDYLDD